MNTNETEKIDDIFDIANIIIAGVTGAGKSTLINAVFGNDFAATGKGRPVTQEIREYCSPNAPVRIWDSIGFEIGNGNDGISKTKASIEKIKQTIEQQASKGDPDRIHAIWYCINQGGSRYQPAEADFVKELYSMGVPFIIIITQCIDDDDEFVKEIEKLNHKNGIMDIPVIEVLAQDRKLKSGCIPAFGLDKLVDVTLEMLPDFIKRSFIAGQKIKVVLKRGECESIITKYEKLAEEGFWDKVPLINMGVANSRFKKMVKEIFEIYNQIISEKDCDNIIVTVNGLLKKDQFNWFFTPDFFNKKNKNKLERLMDEIREKGADGLELTTRDFNESTRTARIIIFYGYTLLMAVEDVWKMIRDEKIQNLEEVVIPQIKDRIQHYLSSKRNRNN